ncbi:hypothetical protein GUJ93_ZPchr0007g4543 [Zizania palustris]|uniref:DUF7597 domain-containing protein n=1 Tax=Zizania palustris TaxID=103762 RepID=A0A8J5TE39_ZIZPA|nr:hypothetical protein GUJ93_ZPchr0007g4543 [Zizania palustris]
MVGPYFVLPELLGDVGLAELIAGWDFSKGYLLLPLEWLCMLVLEGCLQVFMFSPVLHGQFRISVASREVGLLITRIKRFWSDQFEKSLFLKPPAPLSLLLPPPQPQGAPPTVMANFPIDLIMYVPRGGVLIDGGGPLRKSKCVVTLSGQHVKKNEDMAIAICDEAFTALERHEFLLHMHHHITQGTSVGATVVDDQMINVPFHHAPATDQAAPAEPFIIEPMEEEAQWNQWPEHHVNAQPAPQAQDELSIEVSGLSIGLQSGSTNISGNNSSLMAFAQSVEQPMQEIVPRALSPPVQPRPPIKFFTAVARVLRLQEGKRPENPLP